MDVIWTKTHFELIADTLLHISECKPNEISYKEQERTLVYKDVFVSQWSKRHYFIVIAGNTGVYGPRYIWFAHDELRKMNRVFKFLRKRLVDEARIAKELEIREKMQKASDALMNNLPDLVDKTILGKK